MYSTNSYPQPLVVSNTPLYQKPLKSNGSALGVALLVFLFAPIAVLLLIKLLETASGMRFSDTSFGEQIENMLLYVIPFAIAIAVGTKLTKMPTSVAFPLRKAKPSLLIYAVVIAMGAIILGLFLTNMLSNTLENITGYTPTSPEMESPKGVAANIMYFINVAITPAIFEEALFRGVVMQSLRRFGDHFALVASSILFGLAHGNLVQIPYTLVLGLLMGYFVLYTGSLWPGILIHFVNNGSSVILEWFMNSSIPEATQENIIGIYMVLRIIFAIVALILLRLQLGSLFFVPYGNYPLSKKDKHGALWLNPPMIIFIIICILSTISYLTPSGGTTGHSLRILG